MNEIAAPYPYPYLRVILKRGKEESLKRFHPWVFSGAVAALEYEDTHEIAVGDIVDVCNDRGEFLARGHYCGGSIAVRILTFSPEEYIDGKWWIERIGAAYKVRHALGLTDNKHTTCYRLVHGEGDNLPGLIIDIYDQTAVVQCHSTGMFRERMAIAEALHTVYGNRLTSVYNKSSQTLPHGSGFEETDAYLYGATAECGTVLENGHRFTVDWNGGQKTGFFIDQRVNRELVSHYSAGRRVLNTFCYTGGFSVYALAGGAVEVVSVDSSETAVKLAEENVRLNFGPNAPHESVAADTFDYLDSTSKRFDLIILDPPAFAKRHKAIGNAIQGYKRLNAKALSLIEKGGILFTFSCSQAVDKELFRTTVFTAAAIAGRKVRILHQLTQPADHPINIYHPEGEYLKGLVLYVE